MQMELVTGEIKNKANELINFQEVLIGQAEAAKKLRFFVDSNCKETPIPTLLFSGSQGLGKTYTSHIVATALNRKMIEINCGGLNEKEQFYDDILLSQVHGDEPVTLLFDESHKMSREVATELLTLTNPNENFTNCIDYKGVSLIFDMSKINIIFATTDANRMLKPLVNRCEEIYFNLYDHVDLIEIMKLYLGDVELNLSTNKVEEVGYACRGRARTAFLLAQNIRRHCKIQDNNVLDDINWDILADIFGIHPLGLNNKEIKLMKLLRDNGILSCSNLAVKLGVTEDNIKDEWEQRPKELGLIQSTSRGRELTEVGAKYLKDNT